MRNLLSFSLFTFLNISNYVRGYHTLRSLSYQFSPKKYCGYNKVREIIKDFENYDLYTGEKSDKKSVEHIWPQSFFNSKDKKELKKDMYNLSQIDLKTNIFRSNYKFADNKDLLNLDLKIDVSSLKTNYMIKKSNPYKLFYLPERAKGPVSRSIAYIILIYPNQKDKLEKIIDKNDMIEWSILYPVTDLEIEKNKLVEKYQGNINPFIMDPELIKFLKN